jgi:uncharacterized protein (DUF302 family)
MPSDALVTIASKHSVGETIDRARSLLEAGGTRIFARIDHAAAAAEAGLQMRPMQLLIFGDPRAGTPLMLAAPTFGIDLPLKLLAWEDADGRVWLTRQSLPHLAAHHSGAVKPEQLALLESKLRGLAEKAAQ